MDRVRGIIWGIREHPILSTFGFSTVVVGLDMVGHIQTGVGLMEGFLGEDWLTTLLAWPYFKLACIAVGLWCFYRIGNVTKREAAHQGELTRALTGQRDAQIKAIIEEKMGLPNRIVETFFEASRLRSIRFKFSDLETSLASYRGSIEAAERNFPANGTPGCDVFRLNEHATSVLRQQEVVSQSMGSYAPSALKPISEAALSWSPIPDDEKALRDRRPQHRAHLDNNGHYLSTHRRNAKELEWNLRTLRDAADKFDQALQDEVDRILENDKIRIR